LGVGSDLVWWTWRGLMDGAVLVAASTYE